MDIREVLDGVVEFGAEVDRLRASQVELRELQQNLRARLKHDAPLLPHYAELVDVTWEDNMEELELVYRVLCRALDA